MKVMLAKKYEEKLLKNKHFIITPKLDGQRMLLFKNGNSIECYSRNEKKITHLNDIVTDALRLPDGVYDGELLAASGKFQDTQIVARTKHEIKTGLIYHIFDVVLQQPCDIRKEIISKIPESEFIKFVPILYKGNDISVIPNQLHLALESGFEGIIINTSYALYEFKRTSNLLKVKPSYTVDLKVIGYEEGDGKYKGTLGALVCEYKGGTVKVGSGFTDEERRSIWKHKGNIIVEVSYDCETTNIKDGIPSLRFPIFKRIRNDKLEESYD